MMGTVILIFIGVMAAVITFGALTKLMEGAPPAWRTLRELYPSPISAPGPGGKDARFFILDGQNPRPRPIRVRYTTDDDSLDAWPVSVRTGAALGISIPWAGAQLGLPTPTPLGPHVTVTIDGVTLLVPATAIEQDLANRAAMGSSDASGEPPPHPYDPLVEEIT